MIGPSLKSEIESTFEVVKAKSTTEELVILCPECGDASGHRSINLQSGLTFCFRCNKGKNNKGNFIAWAKALGFQLSHAGDVSGVKLDRMFDAPAQRSGAMPVISGVLLPEGFIRVQDEPKSVYTKYIAKMAKRKNLLIDDFIEAQVGFTRDDVLWEPFAIFPVLEYERVVYYQGRTYVDVPGETTKKFPNRKECPFGASYWVYNIDELRSSGAPVALVVESILNVLSLRWKLRELGLDKQIVPVCVFKHFVSNVQLRKLAACTKLQEICMLFDFDAIDKTWDMLDSMARPVAMTIAEMPKRADNKKFDANDDVDAAIYAYENRKQYTCATALGHRLSTQKEATGLSGIRFA